MTQGKDSGNSNGSSLRNFTNAQIGAAVAAGKIDRKEAANFLVDRMIAKAQRQGTESPI